MKNLNKLTTLLIALTISTSLMAANEVVTSNGDSGAGTLRQAIIDAGDGDEITFNLSSGNESISVSSELSITESLTINGSNTAGSGTSLTVQVTTPGTSTWRVFNINANDKTVNISNMTIKGGDISGLASSVNDGGAISIEAGTINLSNITVSDSKAYYGGGLNNKGGYNTDVTIQNSTFTGNQATGSTTNKGGAIYNESDVTLTIINSTFFGNSATSSGGAINSYYTTLTLTNVSIANNTDNWGALFLMGGVLTVKNSLIVNNSIRDFYFHSGTLTDVGYNVVESQSGASQFNDATDILWDGSNWQKNSSNLSNQTLNLAGSLSYEGGYTEVLEVTGGGFLSAAEGVGSTSETTDQRGYYRKSGTVYYGTTPTSTTNYITRGAYQYYGVVARTNTVDSWASGSNNYYTQIQGAENHVSSGSTVKLSGTAILIDSEVNINQSITIDGAGTESTIVRVAVPGTGGTNSRIFYIDAIDVAISYLTIKGGDISISNSGGGIVLRQNGVLNLNCVIISGSKAYNGGGIYAYQSNTLNLSNCSIYGNTSTGSNQSGGGIRLYECNSGTIANCLIYNNTSDDTYGGGISASTFSSYVFEIINSTIYGNTATGDGSDGSGAGGGVWIQNYNCTIKNTTISGNSASQHGGGIYNLGGTLTIGNTIIADNSTNDDYYYSSGTLNDLGYNIVEVTNVGAGSGGFTNGENNDIVGQQANLFGTGQTSQTLADNGGSTQTLALESGSVAIDVIPYSANSNSYNGTYGIDQRGKYRSYGTVTGDNRDIGAYEFDGTDPTNGDFFTRYGTNGNWSATASWWKYNNTAAIWEDATATPTSADGKITIDTDSDVSVNANPDPITVDQTTVSYGGTLTINAGKYMTVADGTGDDLIVDNTMTVNSDATGTGSLIVSGTSTGNVIFKRWVHEASKAATWHYVSAPVADQTLNTAWMNANNIAFTDPAWQFFRWDEDNNYWIYFDYVGSVPEDFDDNTFVEARGYCLTRTSAGELSFTGTVRTSDVDYVTTHTAGEEDGFNLVGNPFTSSIGITSSAASTENFLAENTTLLDDSYEALYIWDEQTGYTGSQNDYKVISNSNITGYTSINQHYVSPGQAFMVKVASTGDLAFNENMQAHATVDFFKNGKELWPSVELIAENNELFNSTAIGFNENMTMGLDPSYDVGKLKGNPDIALYTKLIEDNGVDFAIQALPYFEQDYSVKVGLDIANAGEYTFEAATMEQIPEEVYVYFEDKLTGTVTNLKETDNYTCVISEAGSIINRFVLHFTLTPFSTEETNANQNNIQIWSANKTINILNTEKQKGTIRIINMFGQLILQTNLNGNSNQEIHLTVPVGYYLVNVISDEMVVNRKVLVE